MTTPDHDSLSMVTIHAHVGCAKVVTQWDGYRAWRIPDNPPKVAITLGGTVDEARAAVVAALHDKFIGDWSYEATMIDLTDLRAMHGEGDGDWRAAPCAWCARLERYAH